MKPRNLTLLYLFVFTCFLYACTPEYKRLNNSGYKKIQTQDYEGAFNDFESSIKLNDKFWLSYNNRGASYLVKGNYPKALEDFDMSIKLNQQNPDAYDNRGMCKMFLGDSTGALNDFRSALMYDKQNVKIQTHLGRSLAEMDSCQAALPYLNNAMKKKFFDDCNTEQDLRQLQTKCAAGTGTESK